MEVNFYDNVDDSLLQNVVIIAKHRGKWVYCKRWKCRTYEFPSGNRKKGETVERTARRVIWEETGAVKYTLTSVCVYSVKKDDKETFGMLFCAEVTEFGKKADSEIEKVYYLDDHPSPLTYPDIQPKLVEETLKRCILV